MAKYTKQHFETVARVLRTNLNQYAYDNNKDIDDIEIDASCRVALIDVAVDFHNVFRLDNPRYDADKFWEACGIEDWQDMNQVEEWDLQPYRNRRGVDA